jgi:hypothetical protein
MRSALRASVKRALQLAAVLTSCLMPLQSATLERLTLSDMAVKSTAIVRAKVISSYASFTGSAIYTHYKLQVMERLKGLGVTADVAVRGGVAGGMQQIVPGSPRFNAGDEYVFFLWAGKDGVNQVIGLTQGLFAVSADGSEMLTRNASHELMLDKSGHPVKDQTLVMSMSDLRAQIAGALAGTGK